MKRNFLLAPFSLLLSLLFLVPAATPALAETSTKSAPHPMVADQLTDFKRGVFDLRNEADKLGTTTARRMSWQSHADSLYKLRSQANSLGQQLAELESMKPMASASQQAAIENVRPHLVAVAENLTGALDMMREYRRGVHQGEFAEAVRNLYDHSDSLYEKLDTILDYEKAKSRLDGLELQSALNEGS